MESKKIIIIIGVIVLFAAIAGFFLLNNNPTVTTNDQTTIVLSKSSYMKVPDVPNATAKADKKGIFYYNDADDNLNITSSSNLSASSSVKEMKKLKNSIVTGSKKIKEDNVVIYEKNGTYSIFVENTQYNDSLLIQSSDKNIAFSCWESIKYHDPSDNFKIDNTTSNDTGSGKVVDAVEQTQSAVETPSSSQSSTPAQTTESSSDSVGYGDSYSDFVSSSSSSSRSSGGDSYGDKPSDFV